MTNDLLARCDALNTAHWRLCATLDRLRLAAWKAQGSPSASDGRVYGEHLARLMLTVPTPIMVKVEQKIEALDRRMGEMEEDWSKAQEDRHSIGRA